MICISLWQPWASALFAPMPVKPGEKPRMLKRYETRSWKLPEKYVGVKIGIQASKNLDPDTRDLWTLCMTGVPCAAECCAAFEAIHCKSWQSLPRGAVLGYCVFDHAKPASSISGLDECDLLWGDYTDGRYAWPVLETSLFKTPVPAVGRQGFFDVPVL